MGKTRIMIDIVDIKQAVKYGDIAFYMNEGVIYCKDTTTEECVCVGEVEPQESEDKK